MKRYTCVVIAMALLLPLLLIADGPAVVDISYASPIRHSGETFLTLTDTPVTYTGYAGNFLVVNSGETALEYSSTIYEAAGKVGIGTTSPRESLDVDGNIITTWNNSFFGTWYQGGSNYRLGLDTDINNRTTNIHAYAGDATGEVTFSTGTVGTPVERMRIDDNVTIHSSLDVNDQILQGRVASGNDVSYALIAGDNQHGGYMFWADDYDNGGSVIFDTSDTPGPVHALWVRWLVKNHEGTQVVWEGEAVLEPGAWQTLWYQPGTDTQPRIAYELRLSNDAHPQLDTYQIGTYHFRTTLLMIWISD